MFKWFRTDGGEHRDALREALDAAWARIEFSPDGTVIDVNPAFEKATGYEPGELLGKHHRVLCPPEVLSSDFYREFWPKLAKGQPLTGRFKRIDKNGDELFLRASYTPVRDASGAVTRVVKLAADVTEDATAERASIGQLQALGRVQAVIQFDIDGKILDANDNFLKAVGYTLDEIRGKHHRIFMPKEEVDTPAYREFWADLAKGETFSREYRRKAKNGGDIWISASYNPVKDRYGKVMRIVKFASDITARVRSVELIAGALTRMAEGELDAQIDETLQEAYEPLRADLNRVIGVYGDVISRVTGALHALRGNSRRISDGATDLSARAERQAATLEEIAATIEELTGTIGATAQSSQHGVRTAQTAAARTQEGQQVIEQATAAVRTIEESSRKINEINSVIEAIAFQTNLLALNAAVEAARAGEAGKGFAVVAAEVRNLAQRSSDAAADTTRLIKESEENVARGAAMMSSAVEVFGDIRAQVEALAKGISEIESSNREQSAGVNEINSAVADLDDNTQGNAHASTENASVARALDEELADLAQMLAFFRSQEDSGAARSSRKASAA